MEIFQLNLPSSDFLPDILLLYGYMLGPGMEFGVVRECDCSLVIDKYFCRRFLRCRFLGGVLCGRVFGGRVYGNSLKFREKS